MEASKHRMAKLERLADEDSLAPISNRRAFVRELSRLMSFAERYGAPSSLLFFDVNGMKEINDTHGHGAGDAALLQVANILLEQVRTSDVVGRLGGDEFGVILAQADQAAALEKAASLAKAIESAPLEWQGTTITLELAHGAYTFLGGDNVESALAAADEAMYAHKRGMKES